MQRPEVAAGQIGVQRAITRGPDAGPLGGQIFIDHRAQAAGIAAAVAFGLRVIAERDFGQDGPGRGAGLLGGERVCGVELDAACLLAAPVLDDEGLAHFAIGAARWRHRSRQARSRNG